MADTGDLAKEYGINSQIKDKAVDSRSSVKTTLYLDRSLHEAAKRAAQTAGQSLNGFVVAAIEDRLAAGGSAVTASSVGFVLDNGRRDAETIGPGADIYEIVWQLAGRVAMLEKTIGRSDVPALAPVAGQRPLTVQQVRQAVREILHDHDEPVPHRALLHILLHERGLTLPGRDVSENLRTILVHPKARGFKFERGRGYQLEKSTSSDEPSEVTSPRFYAPA